MMNKLGVLHHHEAILVEVSTMLSLYMTNY